MKTQTKIYPALLCTILLFGLASCEPRIGALPHISEVATPTLIVPLGAEVPLQMIYTAGIPVSFNWYCSGGSFSATGLANVTWQAPAQTGEYELMAMLLDGLGGVIDRSHLTITVAAQAESMQSAWPLYYGSAGYENLEGSGLAAGAGEFAFAASGTSSLRGVSEFILAGIDSQGRFLWQTRLGREEACFAQALAPLPGGGYVMCGSSYFPADSWLDGVVLSLKTGGSPRWQKAYHLAGMQNFLEVLPAADGGSLVLGTVIGETTAQDALVLKLTASGEMDWCHVYGAAGDDKLTTALAAGDSYILGGRSTFGGTTQYRAWLLKIDTEGDISWNHSYDPKPRTGITGNSYLIDLYATDDGGVAAAGYCEYFENSLYRSDLLVLKVDRLGAVNWAVILGENGSSTATCIHTTPDGGFLVAGTTDSSGKGAYDGWLLKLNSFGTVQWQKTAGSSGSEEILALQSLGAGQYLLAGNSTSHGAGGQDLWFLTVDLEGYTAAPSLFTYIAARDPGQDFAADVSVVDYAQAYGANLEEALVVEDLDLQESFAFLTTTHALD